MPWSGFWTVLLTRSRTVFPVPDALCSALAPAPAIFFICVILGIVLGLPAVVEAQSPDLQVTSLSNPPATANVGTSLQRHGHDRQHRHRGGRSLDHPLPSLP